MSKSLLLVGTRKGLFVLESDDRRDWSVRGPFCESWPVYHAVLDRDSGTIYAAAASEWHGSAVWRSPDLGETWAHSSEGLGYDEGGERKVSKVSHVCRRTAGCSSAPRRRDLREHRRRRDLLAADDARGPARQRGVGRPGAAAAWAPRHLGDHPAPGRARPLLGDRPGRQPLRDDRRRADVDAAQQGTARDWPRQHEEVGFCVHKVAPRLDASACTSRTTSACTAATTAASRGRRSPRACRPSSASPPPTHPHDRDTFYVDPARPRPRPDDARRQGGGLAHAGRGLELAAARPAACRRRRVPRRAARGDGDRQRRRARPLLRHEHRPALREPDDGESWSRDRGLFRGSRRSRSRWWTDGRAAPPPDADAALPRAAARSSRSRRRRSTRRSSGSTSGGRACATGSASRARRCGRTSTSTSTGSEAGSTRRSSRARAST